MSEMVERVAMRLYETCAHDCQAEYGRGFKNWQLTNHDEREFCRNMARAAIEAMREPTEAMLEAALLCNKDETREDWQLMIDAALTEEPASVG